MVLPTQKLVTQPKERQELRSSTWAKELFSSTTASKKRVFPETSQHQPANISDLAAHLEECHFPEALLGEIRSRDSNHRGYAMVLFWNTLCAPDPWAARQLHHSNLTPPAFRNSIHGLKNFHFKQPGEILTSAPYSNKVACTHKALALCPQQDQTCWYRGRPTDPCRFMQVTGVHQLLTEPASLPWDPSSSFLPWGEPWLVQYLC